MKLALGTLLALAVVGLFAVPTEAQWSWFWSWSQATTTSRWSVQATTPRWSVWNSWSSWTSWSSSWSSSWSGWSVQPTTTPSWRWSAWSAQPTTTLSWWWASWAPVVTTQKPTTIWQSASTVPPVFPTFPGGMTPGVQKTTAAAAKPPNDNAAVPCGYNNVTEKFGASYYTQGQAGIVGGSEARANEFPWQARINYQNSFICGGSIITSRHILTAAHCIIGSASGYQVVLGDQNRNTADTGERTYKISKIIVHPQNSAQTNVYDLAILVTSSEIALDRVYIRPVCLPESNVNLDTFVGQTAYVSGWGKTTEGGSSSTVLMKANVPVLSQSDCQRSYPGQITSDMMCAGYMAGQIDSCQGDSGGPFVILSPTNGRFYIQGVVSWGYGCARKNLPGVYARVAYAIDWVKSSIATTF